MALRQSTRIDTEEAAAANQEEVRRRREGGTLSADGYAWVVFDVAQRQISERLIPAAVAAIPPHPCVPRLLGWAPRHKVVVAADKKDKTVADDDANESPASPLPPTAVDAAFAAGGAAGAPAASRTPFHFDPSMAPPPSADALEPADVDALAQPAAALVGMAGHRLEARQVVAPDVGLPRVRAHRRKERVSTPVQCRRKLCVAVLAGCRRHLRLGR